MKMQPRISFSVDSLLGRKTEYKKSQVETETGITDLKKEEEEEEQRVTEPSHRGENQDKRFESDAGYVGHESTPRLLAQRGESEEEDEEDELNVDDDNDDDEEEEADEEDDKERLRFPLHHPIQLPLAQPHHHHPPPHPNGLPPSPHHQLLSSLSSSSSPSSPLLRSPFPPSLSPSSPRLPFVPGFNPSMFDKGIFRLKCVLSNNWWLFKRKHHI